MRVFAGFAGIILIAVVLHDAFEVMLRPRRVRRRGRFVGVFFGGTGAGGSAGPGVRPFGPSNDAEGISPRGRSPSRRD